MDILFNINTTQLKNIYDLFLFNKKEKINMVLEPLQAMVQISLLSVLPIGTKLGIQQNILTLQVPSIIQPVNRWYHSDKKNDLYFLFQVIKRWIKWYNPSINSNSPIDINLYNLVTKMSIIGLDNLIKTYNNSDNAPIIQIIYIYKDFLSSNIYDEIHKNPNNEGNIGLPNEQVKIDEVFQGIIKIHNKYIINIIYNTLLVINEDKDINSITNYIKGLNSIMESSNKDIQNWIRVNLII